LRLREPVAAASVEAFDMTANVERRVALLSILSPLGDSSLIVPALSIIKSNEDKAVQTAALQVLAGFDDPLIAKQLVELFGSPTHGPFRPTLLDVLLSRVSFASDLLDAVDRGEIEASSLSIEQVRRIALLGDSKLDALVTRHWGKVQGSSREERLAEVRRLNNDLRAGVGYIESGKVLFNQHCAACHQLFGEGKKVGPDLTSANRQDREFLLVSLVDPSSVIRKEFVCVIVQTTTGRVLTGLAIDRDDTSITLADAKGEKQVIPTSEIEELKDSTVSFMPDNLYLQMKPQQLRDLFAYLQSSQ
jgi:putative heme-binding domain-containing protein